MDHLPPATSEKEVIRRYAFTLSCEDQYWLACMIAENIGYHLEHEVRRPTVEDRLARLEEVVRELNPGAVI